MVQIRFVYEKGGEAIVEAAPDESLMKVAQSAGVDGIIGDCGGVLSCATCHVHVDPAWWDRTGPPSEEEASSLEMASGLSETSRLSCQINVVPALDGLTVRVPASQF